MNSIDQVFTYENFKVIIEHAPIGIVIIDKDFNWLLTNKRFSEITGYSPEELKGKTFLDITHKDDVANNLSLYEQMTSGKVDEYVYEKRYVRKDGNIIWVRLTVAAVRSGGDYSYLIALIQDIEETRKYQHDLEFRNKELDTLFYKASHDLKAPVASLEGLCNLLRTELTLSESKPFEHLEFTIKKLKTQNEFLLQLAAVNELSVSFARTTFASIINSSLKGKESLVDVQIKSDITEITTDSFLLETVFKNLLDNAILYSGQKPRVDLELKPH